MNVQIIEKTGKPEWAVIPFSEYQKLQKALEDAEDIEDIEDIEESLKAIQEGKEITVPGEVTFAILDGVSPVRAWREHKQIKMSELANKAGIGSAYLSQIENGKRVPPVISTEGRNPIKSWQ
ncbi:MAG: helix-turn-helix transcriptional regulator [Deltaproteobacteria bacterium]|nr:helix-turn-helix transcriptional regulator [Deltaproteobacteria bacterium]